MKCPYCLSDNDRVIDSRTSEDAFSIRRRRQCNQCEKRFTTYERITELDIKVIKKNGTVEVFNPEKIRQGMHRACWKRPLSESDLEQAILEIIQQIYRYPDSEIPSLEIGEIVLERLSHLDDVAYIRFASVYREFRDVPDFVEKLRPILNQHNLFFNDSAKPIKKKTPS